MRISDWSSDVCSSDLRAQQADGRVALVPAQVAAGIAVEIVDRHSESSAVAAELVELDRGEPADELRGRRPMRRRGPMPGDWIGRGGANWTSFCPRGPERQSQ